MPANYNKVILCGNLTRNVEIKDAGSSKVANIGLAVNRKWKGSDGTTNEETTFVDIEAWSKLAENCAAYISKGSNVLVEGRLKFDSFTDKDGNKRSKLSVVAETVQFLDSKKDGQNLGAQGDGKPPAAQSGASESDYESPF